MWRSLSGQPVHDVAQAVNQLLLRGRHVLHVGTDSQCHGYETNFATVVAVVDPGAGGRVFYRRQRHPRVPSLAHKLFQEAGYSIETAQMLEHRVPADIVVHIDANADARHSSSKYVRALAGMVLGYGFQVRVKPDAWCATHVADYLLKGKGVGSNPRGADAVA